MNNLAFLANMTEIHIQFCLPEITSLPTFTNF